MWRFTGKATVQIKGSLIAAAKKQCQKKRAVEISSLRNFPKFPQILLLYAASGTLYSHAHHLERTGRKGLNVEGHAAQGGAGR